MSPSPAAARLRARPSPARLRVGVVGAGRVGAPLGAALAAAGHPVVAVAAVSAASRARAAALLPDAEVLDPARVADAADLLLLAVPDDALAGLVGGLAATGALRPGQVVVHTSGRHGLAVLAPAAAVGARVLALHPAQTFTGTAEDLARLPGTRWGTTADPRDEGAAALAAGLVAALGGVAVPVAETARPLYHAALAHGANHLVTLVAQAAEALAAAGVDDAEGVLRPLLTAALEGGLTRGAAATTGPVVRGDAGTVTAHLEQLGEHAPAAVPAYRALARDTADRALADGRLAPRDAEGLAVALRPPTAAAPAPVHP